MSSYNTAMIQGYIQQHYPGLSTDPNFIQTVMNNSEGGQGDLLDQAIHSSPQYQQQQQTNAQNTYNQQQSQAIQTLQTGKANLGQQYADLLGNVKNIYQPQINAMTATTGAALAQRGISPDSQYFQQQTQGALQPVTSAEAANAQQIGQGSVADTNAYNTAISNAQSGQATTNLGIPLNYGSLALQQELIPAEAQNYTQQYPTALQLASMQYGEPFSAGNGQIYNPQTLKFQSNNGGGAPNAMRTALTRMSQRPRASNIRQFVQPA